MGGFTTGVWRGGQDQNVQRPSWGGALGGNMPQPQPMPQSMNQPLPPQNVGGQLPLQVQPRRSPRGMQQPAPTLGAAMLPQLPQAGFAPPAPAGAIPPPTMVGPDGGWGGRAGDMGDRLRGILAPGGPSDVNPPDRGGVLPQRPDASTQRGGFTGWGGGPGGFMTNRRTF